MSPISYYKNGGMAIISAREVRRPVDSGALALDAWSSGLLVGSLVVMSCITLANMRTGVLLHKLILVEVSQHDCQRLSQQ